MKVPRFYCNSPVLLDSLFKMDADIYNHAIRVLRLKEGFLIRIFDEHAEYLAKIIRIEKKEAYLEVLEALPVMRVSPLSLHLGQGLCKGERMDIVIQKAVELGVKEITPVITEHCEVHLDEARTQKRLQHWRGIIISACEQSGQNQLPILHAPIKLAAWLKNSSLPGIVGDPKSSQKLEVFSPSSTAIRVLVGPEGGLTEDEVSQAVAANFHAISLGPRILRTETAAITLLALLQHRLGDL